jgi:hypothetical protein
MTSLDTLASSLSVSTISSNISLGCSNLGLLLGQLVLHHSQGLSNDYWEEKQALYATLDLNSAQRLRNETQYCPGINGVLQREGWQIKFC